MRFIVAVVKPRDAQRGLVERLAADADVLLRWHAGLPLVAARDADAFLDACDAEPVRVLGIEGFYLQGDDVRPDMSRIADLSSVADPAESVKEARRFLGRATTPSASRVTCVIASRVPPSARQVGGETVAGEGLRSWRLEPGRQGPSQRPRGVGGIRPAVGAVVGGAGQQRPARYEHCPREPVGLGELVCGGPPASPSDQGSLGSRPRARLRDDRRARCLWRRGDGALVWLLHGGGQRATVGRPWSIIRGHCLEVWEVLRPGSGWPLHG
jgi:hypothetical protein